MIGKLADSSKQEYRYWYHLSILHTRLVSIRLILVRNTISDCRRSFAEWCETNFLHQFG